MAPEDLRDGAAQERLERRQQGNRIAQESE